MVNIYNPESKSYTITPSGSQEAVSYTYGTTYDDPSTPDVAEELPADVAYSKQVQENRANLGLPANETSAWELYKKGEHHTQSAARYLAGLEAAKEPTVIEEPVIEEPIIEEPIIEEPIVEEPIVEEPIVDSISLPPILGSDQVAVVDSIPQTVVQQVAPPTYYNPPEPITATPEPITATSSYSLPPSTFNTSISNEQASTFSKPLQTAGLSAVPTSKLTYKTHYAGTPGLVDPTLYAPVGGGTGVQQVIYENNLGQRMTVTEMNGTPTTYVPPGFVRKGTYARDCSTATTASYRTWLTGGTVRGYASGGDVALIKLAKMNGFKGDDVATARSFMNASEGLRKKVQAMGTLMNRGGLAMAQGGSVPNQAMIGGQPHRLAYVNPQEEAMMKAAGGTGAPSYGGIPAYFTIMADPNNPPEVGSVTTDPTTGTKYTWNGTSYDITSSSGESLGSTGGLGSSGGGADVGLGLAQV